MPANIKMTLSNGNPTINQIALFNRNANLAAAIPKTNAPLSASMIKRIHNVKPGCGGCGRK